MRQVVHFIGQLLEVKPLEFENSKTKVVSKSTELTMLFDGTDDEGYKKVSVDTVKVDEEYFDELFDKKGQYIAVPYQYTIDQWGEKFQFDKSMPVTLLEKNPFEVKAKSATKQEDKK